MLIQKEDGKLYYKGGEDEILASMTDIQKHYREMQYNLDCALELWATNRPDLFHFNRSELFKIEYHPIPENCVRIK